MRLVRRALKVWAALRVQLWLIPGVTAIVAFLLARVLVEVDREWIEQRDAWFLFQGTSSGARELVSTIASAMITFTGLVFSITVLVLQLASGRIRAGTSTRGPARAACSARASGVRRKRNRHEHSVTSRLTVLIQFGPAVARVSGMAPRQVPRALRARLPAVAIREEMIWTRRTRNFN